MNKSLPWQCTGVRPETWRPSFLCQSSYPWHLGDPSAVSPWECTDTGISSVQRSFAKVWNLTKTWIFSNMKGCAEMFCMLPVMLPSKPTPLVSDALVKPCVQESLNYYLKQKGKWKLASAKHHLYPNFGCFCYFSEANPKVLAAKFSMCKSMKLVTSQYAWLLAFAHSG